MRFTSNKATYAALVLLVAPSACISTEMLLLNNAGVPNFPPLEPNNVLDGAEQQDLYLYMQRAKDWADQRRVQSTANARLRMTRPLGVHHAVKSKSSSAIAPR
jgi:hypothetical protein